MRIALDLDGVLANSIATFCGILNHRHAKNLTVKSFVRWNAWEIARITKGEFLRTLDEAWFEWETIPPTEEGLSKKVAQLRNFGTVDIVTGRSSKTIKYATSWLRRYKIPYDDFVRTESTNAKANFDYDLFIDDSPDLMTLVSSTPDSYGILYSQPWNRKTPELPRISRVRKLVEVPSLLRRIRTQLAKSKHTFE